MSAYTRAWLDAHATKDADLRERLHDALHAHYTEREALESEGYETIQELLDALGEAKDETDEKEKEWQALKEEFDSARTHWEDDKRELLRSLAYERGEVRKLQAASVAAPDTQLHAGIQALGLLHKTDPTWGDTLKEGKVEGSTVGKIIYVDFKRREGTPASAADLYKRACELDESSSTWVEAERLYREALRLEPRFSLAHCNLGNVLYKTNRLAEALEHWARAMDIDPMLPEPHYNIAYCQAIRGQHREAVAGFRNAIERDRRFADAHFNLGQSLYELGEHAEARKVFGEYLALEPTGEWADRARRMIDTCGAPPKRTRRRKKGA